MVTYCDPASETAESGAPVQRQFVLEIRNVNACDELASNFYNVTWIPALPPFEKCTISGGLNPRIRMGAVFAKNARFPVDFLTTQSSLDQTNAISYEIQSVDNAAVKPGPGDLTNVRTVSYSGNAKLVKFGSDVPSIATEPFPLPFKMTFVRH